MTYPSRILALDLETTGLVSNYDYIVQIACAVMEDGEVLGEPFYTYVQPSLDKLKITLSALAVHAGDIRTKEGQTAAAAWFRNVFDYPEPKKVATDFALWLRENDAHALPVVAHNASFDMAFLSQFIHQQRTSFGKTQHLCPVWIDTLSLARLAMPGGTSYGLDGVLLALGMTPRPKDHDALQDALLAGLVYTRLVAMLDTDEHTQDGAHPQATNSSHDTPI